MTLPDFSTLTLVQLVSVFLFFAAVDTGSAWALAAANGNFSTSYAFDFVRTHLLKVGVPLLALGMIGTGVPAIGIPAIPFAFAAAVAILVGYVGVTIKSVQESWADKAVPPPETTP